MKPLVSSPYRPWSRSLALVLGLCSGVGAVVGADIARKPKTGSWPVLAAVVDKPHVAALTQAMLPRLLPQPPTCPLKPVDAAWLAVAPPSPPTLPATPRSLEPRVHLWTRVWGELNEKQTLIVDDRRPWVVFAEVDCNDLYEWGDAAFAKDRCGERVTTARKKAITSLKKGWWKPETMRRYGGNKKLARTAAQNLIGVRGRADALGRAKERAREQLDQAEGLYTLEGVPRLYARAAIVESLWRPEALSRTGAAGVLQFMPVTSKAYLFVQEGLIDERLDPLRSSWAAARYLSDINKQLKSWPLTLTAYNTGPARLKRVIKIRRSADLGQIANAGDIGEYGFDGQNYYAQIVAIARLTKDDVFPQNAYTGRTLKLTAAAPLADLALCTQTTTAELLANNPALLAPIKTGAQKVPAGYVLQVPDDGTRTALRVDMTSFSTVQ
ncbi:MAG: transglycosylase SLT domain-containing protein [Deltaproteobacteria bacterium]|nr:transglycosylase SLT domain-containing protein [Deltaproteobacteria bacterium]